jgi:hypothetical protein
MAFSSHRTRGKKLEDPQREGRMHTTSLLALPPRQLAHELVARGHPRLDNRSEENEPTWCRVSHGRACHEDTYTLFRTLQQ